MEIFEKQGVGDLDARFGMDLIFQPVFVRVHFVRLSGSGTDVAELLVFLEDRASGAHNVRLFGLAAAGVDADLNLRFLREGRSGYAMQFPRQLRVTWSSPDGDELGWGVAVGLERTP